MCTRVSKKWWTQSFRKTGEIYGHVGGSTIYDKAVGTITEFSMNLLQRTLRVQEPLHEERENHRLAAVLVPLYRKSDEWHVLLCKRSHNLAEHPGEMAFPGGALDEGDGGYLECALREAWEEVGIKPRDVEILGSLASVKTRSGYLVSPVVGIIPDCYAFVIRQEEVNEIVEVPVNEFYRRDTNRDEIHLRLDGSLEYQPTYVIGPHLVFGATARILDDLLRLAT